MAAGGGGVYPSMHWAGVCIPACTGQGVVYPSMHWAGWGLYLSIHWAGVSAGGCLPGGRGVSAQGGVVSQMKAECFQLSLCFAIRVAHETKSFKLQESLKVEMGLLEARLENSKRKLESDLRSDFERQVSR